MSWHVASDNMNLFNQYSLELFVSLTTNNITGLFLTVDLHVSSVTAEGTINE